jgi:hypothetical protein
MKVSCTLCDQEVETKNDDFYMTMKWCFEEMIKLNEIQLEKDLRRVVGVCSQCWTEKLKNKLSIDDYYWLYNKEI